MDEPMHVGMTFEEADRLTSEQRVMVYESLIRKMGVTGAYLPIPFRDEATRTVGLNIVPIRD